MANSTFSGPIRSESTIKTVSKNATTGAITEVITMGDAPVALGDEDKTLTNATHSGRTLVIPAITANRTITLPSPIGGSHFKFVYGGAAEETENLIIVTPGNSNFFLGGVVLMETLIQN
jgi:frataxin-like iron-binding protein CyaY